MAAVAALGLAAAVRASASALQVTVTGDDGNPVALSTFTIGAGVALTAPAGRVAIRAANSFVTALAKSHRIRSGDGVTCS
jgi:hypothetical protein